MTAAGCEAAHSRLLPRLEVRTGRAEPRRQPPAWDNWDSQGRFNVTTDTLAFYRVDRGYSALSCPNVRNNAERFRKRKGGTAVDNMQMSPAELTMLLHASYLHAEPSAALQGRAVISRARRIVC